MAKEMNVKFKFDISEMVEHTVQRDKHFFLIQITGRIAEECPGGIQKKYQGRVVAFSQESIRLDKQIALFHEEELIKASNQSVHVDQEDCG